MDSRLRRVGCTKVEKGGIDEGSVVGGRNGDIRVGVDAWSGDGALLDLLDVGSNDLSGIDDGGLASGGIHEWMQRCVYRWYSGGIAATVIDEGRLWVCSCVDASDLRRSGLGEVA